MDSQIIPSNPAPVLIAKGIQVHRRHRHILKGVDLELRRGEVIGLVGANGSGKSTFLKAILQFIPRKQGTIEILGRKVESYEPTELARKVAYLAQENECRWPITVARLVALGRIPYQKPWQENSEEDWNIVHEAMKTVAVDHLAGRAVTRLSGGERHRVLFARALASEPEILLADEPTTGLDPYHQLHLMELLRGQAQSGRSVVVVLHDLTQAARFCDRLILLKDGAVLASGTPAHVVSSAHLLSAYGIEAKSFSYAGEHTVIPWSVIS
ncbi:MAG: ABC transporter ATP-binding protein [Opitutales bacterium]|nr:ABC transporter ATP-binding protein [Opitutales bacterium]